MEVPTSQLTQLRSALRADPRVWLRRYQKSMSMHSRERKRRIREFNRIYKKGSISIGGWDIWQIHETPDQIEENYEIDFWCSNGKDVILTSLQNSNRPLREVSTGPRQGPRVFVGFKFKKLETDELEKVVAELNSGKVRKYKR